MTPLRLSGCLAAALLVTAALTACQDQTASLPQPREPGRDAVGTLCHMTLSDHGGPKGQVFLKGPANGPDSAPLWFSSVRDTFTWLMVDEGLDKSVAAIWVNDMGRATNWEHPEAGTWIDARKALFVIGSDKAAGMGGGELVPFSDKTAAQAFIAKHGGRVVAFSQIDRDLVTALNTSAEQAASAGAQ